MNQAYITQDELNQNMIKAVKFGNLPLIIKLIKDGADIHADNDYALTLAATHGHLSVVEILVSNGSDIHSLSDMPLIRAAQFGHHLVVDFLVRNGADIHSESSRALKEASIGGRLQVVEILVKNGADVDVAVIHGRGTVIKWATAYKNLKLFNDRLQSELQEADTSISEHKIKI